MTSVSKFRNALLRNMPPDALTALVPHLESVSLPVRLELERPNATFSHVYFIESGLASVVAMMSGGRDIEAGIVGTDGMTGLSAVLGDARTPQATFMQIAGSGMRISTDVLREKLASTPTLQKFLLGYVQAFLSQTISTALANGQLKLEERLARWLLMTHDRLDGNEIHSTHEFLAVMLGVRRPGVTVALHVLEGKGFLQSNRGKIVVVNREGLEREANGGYGVAEREYERLVGAKLSRSVLLQTQS